MIVYKHIEIHLKKLQSISGNIKTQTFGVQLLEVGARTEAFKIEALLRLSLLRKDLGQKKIKKLQNFLKDIKLVEDLLGKMDEIQTNSKTSSNDKQSERELQRISLKLNQVFSESVFLKPQILSEFNWLKYKKSKKEIKFLNKAIQKEHKRVVFKVKKQLFPDFKKQAFSHLSMENNFHEFRRDLRWIAIYISELSEVYSLTKYDLKNALKKQKAILKKYKGNIFTKLKSQKTPSKINRFNYYWLSDFIAQAGELKDQAESYFNQQVVKNKNIDSQKMKQQMVKLMKQYVKSDIYKNLFIKSN